MHEVLFLHSRQSFTSHVLISSFSSQGFSELGMTSESKALKSLFFGQVCLTVDLTPIPPGLGMGLGDIYIVLM